MTDTILCYLKKIINIRKKLNILDSDTEYNRIINVDETPIYLDMYDNYTIYNKGANNIVINTTKDNKKRISLVLAVAGGEYKLPPLIIIKGKKNGYL